MPFRKNGHVRQFYTDRIRGHAVGAIMTSWRTASVVPRTGSARRGGALALLKRHPRIA